jgi:glycosyltransferase involved in cell wall biosynthesis
MFPNPKVSIVIPTYNEENDILQTLNYLDSLEYEDYEIIIVDDSNDSTPQIIKSFESNKINYFKPKLRSGRCEARNIGIKMSKGEIIIILNADVLLPKNFINQILIHYKRGADYVLVDSSVNNLSSYYARYIDCQHKFERSFTKKSKKWMWTEGFSIRKDKLMQTNLFPSGYIVPIVAGEDARFGQELINLNFNKVLDLDIIVTHNSPSSFEEFWRIRKGRGQGTPQIRCFLDNWSLNKILFYEIIKLTYRIFSFVLIIPNLISSLKWAFMSPKKYRVIDLFRFFYCKLIEDAATSYGALTMLKKIGQLKR